MNANTTIISKGLDLLGIKALNEMQNASIQTAKEKSELVLLSDTGSGKTLAFLIPMIEKLTTDKTTQALIVVPSRELAMQIEKVFKQMQTGFKITCCYGGHLRETEENNLIEPPALIVGTPGRLGDHIRRGNITKDTITHICFDEFDKLLELGFQEETKFILKHLPNLNFRMLTSATQKVAIPDFVELKNPTYLNFLSEEEKSKEVLSIKYIQSDVNKLDTLFNVLCNCGAHPTIVFCNERDMVQSISEELVKKGIVSEYYHGALEQKQREKAICKFRNGTVHFLITTDLAARGLDIDNVRNIIHFDIPMKHDEYIHRNGRTARMDKTGTVILILDENGKLPSYIDTEVEELQLKSNLQVPEKPKWTTLYLPLGKKDKVNKIDIVGYLSKMAEQKKEDIGLIEVKDFFSFVAVRKSQVAKILDVSTTERIKNKKAKFEVAK